jgi:uncharacterized membrane protein
MKILLPIIVALTLALLGAHYLRYGNELGLAASLILIGLLFLRSAWVARVIQAALVLGAIEWAHTLYELLQMRMAHGAPMARMAAIIGSVIGITLASALLFQTKTMKRTYGLQPKRLRTEN